MTETRLRWEKLSSGPILGYVTFGQWLFQIGKPGGDADDPELELTSYLPGLDGDCKHGTDPEVLKAEAERWLEEFITSLGAVFPEPRPGRRGKPKVVHLRSSVEARWTACGCEADQSAVRNPAQATCKNCLKTQATSPETTAAPAAETE